MRDTVVLLSQGYHGANAVGAYPIGGIVTFGSPDLNDRMMYVSLAEAEVLFDMPDMRTSLVVIPKDDETLQTVKSELSAQLGDEYEVMDYAEMLPDLMQAREFDVVSGKVILWVLYLIIGFGIFGTILMMLKEREYEFGVLKAIGMKSVMLYSVVWLETLFVALLGCVLGILLAIPIVRYLTKNPIRMSGEFEEMYENFGMEAIIPFKTDYSLLLAQALIILALTTIMSVYAYFKIRKLSAVSAIRR